MCGIVGYIGTEQAAPIILDGLSKLEYRGYDSAGMAVFDGKCIQTKKAIGRLKVLESLTKGGETMVTSSNPMHSSFAQPFRVERNSAVAVDRMVQKTAVSVPTKTLFHRLTRYWLHTVS